MACKNFSFRYLSIIIIIFPLIIFILTLIELKANYDPTLLGELSSSINDYPLSNFEYSAKCNDSVQYSSKIYSWPGTVAGCTCETSVVDRGNCDEEIDAGCKGVDPVSSKDFYYWGEKEFCSKKYDGNYTYLNLLKNSVNERENCSEGLKKCGILDTLGNILCYPVNEECPINDIIVSDTERSDLPDYKVTQGHNKYFYYTNKAIDKKIITKLKVAEGKVCTHKSYFNTDFPQFILDKNFKYYGCSKKIGGNYIDNDVNEIDFMSKRNLFLSENFNLESEAESLDINYEYPFQSLSAKMILYTKNYIGFDYACLLNNNFTTPDLFGENFCTDMNNYMNSIPIGIEVITGISITGVVLILIISINVIIFYDDDDDNCSSNTLFFVWIALTIIIYLGMAIPGHINLNKILKLKTFPECGDIVTNEKISYFNDASRIYRKYGISSLCLTHVHALFIIFALVFKYIVKKLK